MVPPDLDLIPPDLVPIEQALAREDPQAASAALIAFLETQTDPLSALTLRVLAQTPFSPDAMAATLERLVALIRAQETQIRALEAFIEPRL